MLRVLAMTWGIGGVLALLFKAIWRLTPRAVEALEMDLAATHWAFAVPWVLFMAYSEGHKGFHKSFSPRVVARTLALGRDLQPVRVALAPAFVMGFFHGTRRRVLTSWILTTFIVLLILGVRLLDQPWRGLVDLGVVVGLSWGCLSISALGLKAWRDGGTDVDPQLPAASAG